MLPWLMGVEEEEDEEEEEEEGLKRDPLRFVWTLEEESEEGVEGVEEDGDALGLRSMFQIEGGGGLESEEEGREEEKGRRRRRVEEEEQDDVEIAAADRGRRSREVEVAILGEKESSPLRCERGDGRKGGDGRVREGREEGKEVHFREVDERRRDKK